MRTSHPVLRAAAAVAALASASTSPAAAQERPPAPVTVARAEVREMTQRERVIGSLRAESEAVLAALEEGAVASVVVRPGQAVAQGDPLVEIDARRLLAMELALKATRAEAEAARVQRTSEVDDARTDLGALEAAAVSDAISARDLRRARTQLAVSSAQLTAAESRLATLDAELALLALRIEDATLRAPFDGVVVERHVDGGEWVKPGDAMVTLVSAHRLEVWFDVPERRLAALREIEGPLQVRLGSEGPEVRASAPRVVPRVDPSSRTFPLVATLEGAHSAASPGLSASAWLPIGEVGEALMVPKDALVYRPSGVAVMVVQGADRNTPGDGPMRGTAMLVPVVVRFETEREVAIGTGATAGAIEAGTLVVVEGNERLFPGTPVMATVGAPRGEERKAGPSELGNRPAGGDGR